MKKKHSGKGYSLTAKKTAKVPKKGAGKGEMKVTKGMKKKIKMMPNVKMA